MEGLAQGHTLGGAELGFQGQGPEPLLFGTRRQPWGFGESIRLSFPTRRGPPVCQPGYLLPARALPHNWEGCVRLSARPKEPVKVPWAPQVAGGGQTPWCLIGPNLRQCCQK